jgi:RNA 3'-terminal phosphate cyclase (ATP)
VQRHAARRDVGSQHLELTPNAATPEPELTFDIGTADRRSSCRRSVPAIVAGHALRFTVIGGTHNPMAPPFDFLDRVFVPHLRAMGADVTLTLERYGFVTGGGGRDKRAFYDAPTNHRGQLVVTIGPGALHPTAIVEAGPITSRHAVSLIARLPTHVADRELASARPARLERRRVQVRVVEDGGRRIRDARDRRAGQAREPSRRSAKRACAPRSSPSVRAPSCRVSRAGVGRRHLADQLLLPMAVAAAVARARRPLRRRTSTRRPVPRPPDLRRTRR